MENRRANYICKQEAIGCYAGFAGQAQQRENANEAKDAAAVLFQGSVCSNSCLFIQPETFFCAVTC